MTIPSFLKLDGRGWVGFLGLTFGFYAACFCLKSRPSIREELTGWAVNLVHGNNNNNNVSFDTWITFTARKRFKHPFNYVVNAQKRS